LAGYFNSRRNWSGGLLCL